MGTASRWRSSGPATSRPELLTDSAAQGKCGKIPPLQLDVRWKHLLKLQAGGSDEQGKGSSRDAERRVHPDVRRQARTLGCQRPTLCRMGDLPPQGLAC